MTTPETVTEPYWVGTMAGARSLRDEFALRLAGIRTFFPNDSPQETDIAIKNIFDLADKLATEAARRRKS